MPKRSIHHRPTTDAAAGRVIRRMRHAHGLTLQQLAFKLGLAYQQLQRYETGATPLTLDMVFQLAAAFFVPAHSLVAGIGMELDCVSACEGAPV